MPALIQTFQSQGKGRFGVLAENATADAGSLRRDDVNTLEDYHVYIESSPGSNQYQLAPVEIDWSSVLSGLNEVGTSAHLVVRALDASKLTSAGKLGAGHLKHLLEKLGVNQRVVIAKTRGAGQLYIIFSGFPVAGSMSWSEKHQGIAWTCVSDGEEWIKHLQSAQIIGRIMRKYPFKDPDTFSNSTNFDLIEVDVWPPMFNAGGQPNMLNQVLQLPNTAGMRVFAGDGDKDAKFWHYANALRYVASFYASYVNIDVLPLLRDTTDFITQEAGGSSSDPFSRLMLQRVDGVSIASMSAHEAIAALCGAAGLHFEIARRRANQGNQMTHWMRIVAPVTNAVEDRATRSRNMVAPESRNIPRDAPFTNYTGFAPADIADRNAAQQSHLTADDRVINKPIVLGGPQDFEVTLLFRPGWKPFRHLDLDIANIADGPPPEDMTPMDALALKMLEFWVGEFGDEAEEREDNGVPKSKYHTQHPDHHEVADVGRLWIFPDTADYMTPNSDFLEESPYARQMGPWKEATKVYSPYANLQNTVLIYTHGVYGGGLPADVVRDWVLRRRPLGNMLSRTNLQVEDFSPRVEMNYKDATPEEAMQAGNRNWIPFTGSVLIDPTRAALWIKEDNLLLSPKLDFEAADGSRFNYIEAFIGLNSETGRLHTPNGSRLWLRVTCTIRGDQRLISRPPQTHQVLFRQRCKIIDMGFDQFRRSSRVHGNSAYRANPEPDARYQDREDATSLDNFARDRQDQLDRLAVGGDWEANYIEDRVRLGDSFRGVEGLGVGFGTWPVCTAIEYIKDPDAGYRTKFHLSDLRHAPDVGVEA